ARASSRRRSPDRSFRMHRARTVRGEKTSTDIRSLPFRGMSKLHQPGPRIGPSLARNAQKTVHSRNFFRSFSSKSVEISRNDTKIAPDLQKKESRMAKAKILKFDASGPGLSKPEILKVCGTENVRFMRLQFTDILGVIKNVEIPRSQFE